MCSSVYDLCWEIHYLRFSGPRRWERYSGWSMSGAFIVELGVFCEKVEGTIRRRACTVLVA